MYLKHGNAEKANRKAKQYYLIASAFLLLSMFFVASKMTGFVILEDEISQVPLLGIIFLLGGMASYILGRMEAHGLH